MTCNVKVTSAAVALLSVCLQLIPSAACQRFCRTINAGFTLNADDGGTYFLSGKEYIEYNFQYGSEARVGPITELGLAETLEGVQAAFTDTNGSAYFLQECQFFRYHRTATPKGVLSLEAQGNIADLGLPCNVDAAIRWGGENLVFRGCEIWKLNPQTARFELKGSTSDRGLPCQIDAAVAWGATGAVFVKGSRFWKFENSMLGPFHTDDLHLCSWYLCCEADWMRERRRSQKCNGDERFCHLRLDQVTLAGLHNAGAGFAGGFGLFNCFLRNHAESITRQLELGIRHLDIDPCFDTCGLLGTCHSFMCGGSICPIIKQVRSFLRDNRGEIVTLNFNHEIKEPEKVFSRLTRQLKTQLGPMLNKRFRMSGEKRWPTLQRSIRTNQRVFIFYAPIIENAPYNGIYKRNKWILNENFYGSTWRPFSVSNGCQGMVPLTAERCQVRENRELVEVSTIPESGSCISGMADMCRPYLQEALRACEPFRFVKNKSPNVLLVDYPEEGRQDVTSVFNAVYHQNLRNVINHLSSTCHVKIDAAVRLSGSDISLFFVGTKVQVFNHTKKGQMDSKLISGLTEDSIDAAYAAPNANLVRLVKGCETWDLDAVSLNIIPGGRTLMRPCVPLDDAVYWQSQLYTFKGCSVTRQGQEPTPLADWGLPCNIDAALSDKGNILIFKGNSYWRYTGQGHAINEGKTLDWTVDVVQCQR